jgi:hypothetical protein
LQNHEEIIPVATEIPILLKYFFTSLQNHEDCKSHEDLHNFLKSHEDLHDFYKIMKIFTSLQNHEEIIPVDENLACRLIFHFIHIAFSKPIYTYKNTFLRKGPTITNLENNLVYNFDFGN